MTRSSSAVAVVIIAVLLLSAGCSLTASAPSPTGSSTTAPVSARVSMSDTATLSVPQCPAYATSPYNSDSISPLPAKSPVATGSYLAPDEAPLAAVVCSYGFTAAANTSRVSRPIIGNLNAVRSLHWATPTAPSDWEKACPANIPDRSTVDYIGLSYPKGVLWVRTDDSPCVSTAANNANSTIYLGVYDTTAAAAATGAWPTADQRSPTLCPKVGTRYGVQEAIVPPGPTSVSICHWNPDSTAVTTTDLTGLVSQLNSTSTTVTSGACSGPGSVPGGPSYRLWFTYPSGSGVAVTYQSGCSPAAANFRLQTAAPASVLPLIEAITG